MRTIYIICFLCIPFLSGCLDNLFYKPTPEAKYKVGLTMENLFVNTNQCFVRKSNGRFGRLLASDGKSVLLVAGNATDFVPIIGLYRSTGCGEFRLQRNENYIIWIDVDGMDVSYAYWKDWDDCEGVHGFQRERTEKMRLPIIEYERFTQTGQLMDSIKFGDHGLLGVTAYNRQGYPVPVPEVSNDDSIPSQIEVLPTVPIPTVRRLSSTKDNATSIVLENVSLGEVASFLSICNRFGYLERVQLSSVSNELERILPKGLFSLNQPGGSADPPDLGHVPVEGPRPDHADGVGCNLGNEHPSANRLF